jgi:Sec7-like guanine-nucleotide exchange factor
LSTRNGNAENCTICRDLLANLELFYNMLENARRAQSSDWLTVEDIAAELKISKSIVYRLIRKGKIEAVDIVDTDGEIPKKGHYRIKRESLTQYLESKKVRPFPTKVIYSSRSRRLPKVKNHLGL